MSISTKSAYCITTKYFLLLLAVCLPGFAADRLRIGVASVDITPDYPVRLNGFGFRRTESEGVTQRIHAKALAFADEKEGPSVLITTDNLCVSDEITKQVGARLKEKVGLKLERLTVTATHTHTAPMLSGVAPTIFGTNIPPEHLEHIERYTRDFQDKLVQVAAAAIADIQPAQLSWGRGEVKFAINRRTPGGPVDHDFSAIFVKTPEGKVRAVYFSYACHCVTLSHNQISGDWAGAAQEAVQKLFPGAIALASVGCGADSNPNRGVSATNFIASARQGEEIAEEVNRLSRGELRPITAGPTIYYDRVDLPLDTPRTKEQWQERARSTQYAVAYHARLNLTRLERGETLPTTLNYPIQTWVFGEQLAMLFLPGESVVDYSLRLKREFERARIWINAYANDGRCYIPSERILREGGYEGGDAMIYYDRPQRFAPGVEQRIIDVVRKQIPNSFLAANRTEGVRALGPEEALRSIHTKPGLEVELVASEPMIVDPVAIDWGGDGRLWVCEMNDYPAGMDGNWQPGGRVKVLEDTNADGVYDKATVFAENLSFPTGVTAWGKGALICAAPDILYAEDTNGDGKADRVEKVFSGFFTDNFQARVNSLQLGLDNWIYGANGLLGGSITPHPDQFPRLRKGPSSSTSEINIRNRDFRFSPFTGEFETVTGLSQQGRVRDDWGNWFGCNNSELLLHFGLPEQYLRRNPHVSGPPAARNLTARPEGNRLYPRSRLLARFNDPDNANHTTSACGLAIYRDSVLGEEYRGNAFTCEVVHNLVHREVIHDDDGIISSSRPSDEGASEFLASTDNWFRPVQVRTGPDGALYVVDMYRFLIEHPRWIPAARLARIDVRAGSDMGRIYRIRPKEKQLRPIRNLAKLTTTDLAAALDSPNGTERDRVHEQLLLRQDSMANPTLKALAHSAGLPEIRIQALAVLDGLGLASSDVVSAALADPDPRVRKQALRVSEPLLRGRPDAQLSAAVLALTNDSSNAVLEQLAFTLGEWNDKLAGRALAAIALKSRENSVLRTAALTSASTHCDALLEATASLAPGARSAWVASLVSTAAILGDDSSLVRAFGLVLQSKGQPLDEFLVYAPLLEALERRKMTFTEFLARNPALRSSQEIFERQLQAARTMVSDENMPVRHREAAIAMFARRLDSVDDIAMLSRVALGAEAERVRNAALAALHHQHEPGLAEFFVQSWSRTPLAVRPQIVALLLSREEWAAHFLNAIRSGSIQPAEVSFTDRQAALNSPNGKIRQQAAAVFNDRHDAAREQVVAGYKQVSSLPTDAAKGRELFAQNCAACHLVSGIGAEVGPNLSTLRDKEPEYWVKNILDPNAVIEPRFVAYEVELKDDRSLTGIIKAETPNKVVLVQGGGTSETIERADIRAIRPSKISLMPEGLENVLSPEQMAHLIGFLKHAGSPPQPVRGSPELVLRDPVSVARLILDASQSSDLRNTAISSNPQFAADLIREMTRDIHPGTPQEYDRIPWLWRVAIAAGKRNDTEQLRKILEVSLPQNGEPLHDWQAVVIGGGLINGVSQRGLWPRERFQEILALDPSLAERWSSSLKLAAAMADNEKIPSGTRYDALRLLGVTNWATSGQQIVRYLRDKNAELQMGAVSAAGDIEDEKATRALLDALVALTNENRKLAIAALFRSPERRAALAAAVKGSDLAKLSEDERRELSDAAKTEAR